ncbi:MAG: glycosyltransferase, partial [Erysipelotrichales bacterium]|nr:glycosyltransferase [Erysipelotrichales bacterium]
MNEKFSVLMSLYIKEKPSNLIECFESLLNQTCLADEWVIVEDGPLTKELYHILDLYDNKFPGLIKRVRLEINRGLGLALREGIIHCQNEIIARMDTDDIARVDRFEKQLAMFEK